MSFRVATYNVRKCVGLDWRRRPDRILSVIQEIGADVVALQEVDRRFGARETTLPRGALAEAGWQVAGHPLKPASLGWHGNAILVKDHVTLQHVRPIDLPFLEPRGAASADLVVAGRAVRVVGMHLGLTPGPRVKQVAAILAHLEEHTHRPTVIAGDTNEWRALAGCLARLSATHRLSPPAPTFHASMPVAPLDRIATTADLVIRASGVHASETARQASDHLPLWADLCFLADHDGEA